MSELNQCINLNMTLGAQYDINIKKEQIYVGPYIELLNGTMEVLDDTVIPNDTVWLRDYLFYENTSLTTVSLQNITSIGISVFKNTMLNQIDLPNLELAGSEAFAYTRLQNIVLPKLINVSPQMFQGCDNLISADFSSVETIGTYAFYNCANFESLILRNENIIPELNGASVFSGTKIETGEGHIYVPESIIREFKGYAGWSAYASQILPIQNDNEIS